MRRLKAKRALALVKDELDTIIARHPPLHSTHEGYAIILEELDETWDEVKRDDRASAVAEAIQVAATAIRFVAEFGTFAPTAPDEAPVLVDAQAVLDPIVPIVAEVEAPVSVETPPEVWPEVAPDVAPETFAVIETPPAPPAPEKATLADLLARTTARIAARGDI